MAQWDVHRNPSPRSRDRIPYLLDVQADLLRSLQSRVVVPLYDPEAFGPPARKLNPVLVVEGRPVIASFAEIAGVPVSALGEKVDRVEHERTTLVSALDCLLSGV
ncbi:MAG: CcdB family protein [Bradymonadia bacterium]